MNLFHISLRVFGITRRFPRVTVYRVDSCFCNIDRILCEFCLWLPTRSIIIWNYLIIVPEVENCDVDSGTSLSVVSSTVCGFLVVGDWIIIQPSGVVIGVHSLSVWSTGWFRIINDRYRTFAEFSYSRV